MSSRRSTNVFSWRDCKFNGNSGNDSLKLSTNYIYLQVPCCDVNTSLKHSIKPSQPKQRNCWETKQSWGCGKRKLTWTNSRKRRKGEFLETFRFHCYVSDFMSETPRIGCHITVISWQIFLLAGKRDKLLLTLSLESCCAGRVIASWFTLRWWCKRFLRSAIVLSDCVLKYEEFFGVRSTSDWTCQPKPSILALIEWFAEPSTALKVIIHHLLLKIHSRRVRRRVCGSIWKTSQG